MTMGLENTHALRIIGRKYSRQYVVTGYCNFSIISDFFIHDFNIYSNHAPISFDFKVNTVQNNMNKCNGHTFFKWDPKYKDQFIKDIASTI